MAFYNIKPVIQTTNILTLLPRSLLFIHEGWGGMKELEIILSIHRLLHCFDYISWFHIEEFVRTKSCGFQVKNR